MPEREQHSADGTWYIEGGERGWFHMPSPWDWKAVVAGRHVATFLTRKDAREYIRGRKRRA